MKRFCNALLIVVIPIVFWIVNESLLRALTVKFIQFLQNQNKI